jgi:hypothetical protein
MSLTGAETTHPPERLMLLSGSRWEFSSGPIPIRKVAVLNSGFCGPQAG